MIFALKYKENTKKINTTLTAPFRIQENYKSKTVNVKDGQREV